MTDVVRFIASFKPKYGLGLCGNFSLNWQSTPSNSDLAGLSAREARAAEYHQWEKLVSNASNKFWFWENGPNVRPPLHVNRGEILHFNHPRILTVNRTATRTFRDKKQQQSHSFFRLNFNVYIDVDNRERARDREIKNKRDQFCWKHENFMAVLRIWEMLAATKVIMSGSEKKSEQTAKKCT